MTAGERIAAELRRAWNGAPWHGPSAAEVIGRVDARQAATRRARGSHTPWQLVLHLTTWVETPLRRLDDPAYDPAEGDNFPDPSSTTVEQWQHDVVQLGATRRVGDGRGNRQRAEVAHRPLDVVGCT